MTEDDMRRILQTMEIPVTVEIPNAVIINKQLMRNGVAAYAAYVICRRAFLIYAKQYVAKHGGEKE